MVIAGQWMSLVIGITIMNGLAQLLLINLYAAITTDNSLARIHNAQIIHYSPRSGVLVDHDKQAIFNWDPRVVATLTGMRTE